MNSPGIETITHGSILTHRTDEEEGGQREKKERNEYRVRIDLVEYKKRGVY
jgi:hypothetical protein